MRWMLTSLAAVLIGCGLWAGATRAETVNAIVQLEQPDNKDAKARATRKPQKRLDGKSRAAAMAFAAKHHPELADLLKVLRKADTQHYETALRELAYHAERLGKMAERKDERYAVPLDLWKLESRFRLLVARLTMAGDEEIDAKVRPMLVERARLKRILLQMEEKRAVTRLERLREQIATTSDEARIAAELERIRRNITRGQRSKTAADEPRGASSRRTNNSRTEPASQETGRSKESPPKTHH